MDQEKIGKFIASLRKEKSLTQADLANKLYITDRAVSKWETGKSFPNAEIMLDLCDILGISVTELLKGERIKMENYKKETENELIEITKKENEFRKKLLIALIFIIVLIIFTSLIMFIVAAQGNVSNPWKTILIVNTIIILVAGIVVTLALEYKVGYYKCSCCGKTYVPNFFRFLLAFNFGMKKKMKCPYCKNNVLHKKVLSRE